MDQVLEYLKKLLKKDDTVVVAVSGGPDSTLLLYLLAQIKDINIVVAHVNHKLREESEEEALFVKKLALDWGFLYEYMEIKEYNHDNLENEARQKRYSFFKELVNKYHAKYLMTAHHGDDLIETILMRLVRGSSIKGYAGFKKVVNEGNYKIVRPLITITKEDIIKYLDENNIKYYIDKSNYSLDYTRNRYRMQVLPFLKKENENVHLKFLKFSEELEKVNNFLDSYIKELIKSIKNNKGIDINKLLELDEFLIIKVIEYELSLIYVNDLFLVSDKNTKEIYNLIKNKRTNIKLNLPNNYVAIKEYNYFKIVNNKSKVEFSEILDKEVIVPNGIIKKVISSDKKNNFVIRLNSKDIKLPLIVRNRKDGDKMEVKNLGGSKKIKDIFIDEKISQDLRDSYPVVCDSENNILWVAGVKKSKFDVEIDGKYDIILAYEEELK